MPSWKTYTNSQYGYSLNVPEFLSIEIRSDEYVKIGDKIAVVVWNIDPTLPLGDKPIVETSTDVQLSSEYSAKLLAGYLGVVGGFIPQQYRSYIIERNGLYFVITLYAVGLYDATEEDDLAQIGPLNPDDIPLFERIVKTMTLE